MTLYILLLLRVAALRCWARKNLLSVLSVSLWLVISGFFPLSIWELELGT